MTTIQARIEENARRFALTIVADVEKRVRNGYSYEDARCGIPAMLALWRTKPAEAREYLERRVEQILAATYGGLRSASGLPSLN